MGHGLARSSIGAEEVQRRLQMLKLALISKVLISVHRKLHDQRNEAYQAMEFPSSLTLAFSNLMAMVGRSSPSEKKPTDNIYNTYSHW
jgi:hypothetical protein